MLRESVSLAAVRAAGQPTDDDLVAAVREGDDRAFERLYDRYHRRIAAFVNGMVHDHARAEDLTQDVFVSALRRMRETDRPITFKPWVYEIAKNACIDAFRRTRRAELVSIDADGDDALEGRRLAGREPTPDVAVDQKLELETLQGAFGGLSDAHHQILVLRELEGRSYKEIGDRLDLSPASVESTLFRARRRLEQEYAEITSGERCHRVRALIADGAGARLGLRDEKRMARHVSYCQPCRREAVLAGFDVATLSPRPLRRRIAAWLPLPVVFKRWLGGGADVTPFAQQAGQYAEPAGGWAKAAAVAVTAALAAGGAGAATDGGPVFGDDDPPAAVERSAAAKAAAASGAAATPAAARGVTGADRAAVQRRGARSSGSGGRDAAAGSSAGAGDDASSGRDTESARTRDSGAAGSGSDVGSTVAETTAPVRETASGATKAVEGATGVSTSDPTTSGRTVLPKVTGAVGGAVQGTGSAVQGTADGAAGTVKQTTDAVTGTAGQVVGGVTGSTGSTAPTAPPATSSPSPGTGTLSGVTDKVTSALGGGG